MKPPAQIHVGPATYRVKVRKHMELLGERENEQTEILIQADQSLGCMRDTLLHECLHAVVFCSGHGYQLEHDEEERLVRRLAPWLLGLVRDNPKLVRFLTECP